MRNTVWAVSLPTLRGALVINSSVVCVDQRNSRHFADIRT